MSVSTRLASATALPLRHFLNLALNVIGIAVPVLTGVLTIPPLVRQLGQDGFATLALGWTVVGYFSLLDLGLSRALTMHIARRSAHAASSVAAMAGAARRMMIGLGCLWALVLSAAYPVVIARWPVLTAQSASPLVAWLLLVLCIPFTLWMNSSASMLEAESRFVDVNLVRIPLGIAVYVGPLVASFYLRDIAWIFASLLLTRVAAAVVLAYQVRDRFARSQARVSSMAELRPLLTFGGWMTVSQVVGPVLVYFDRFAIATLVSVAAVTHYTVPFDVLTRLPLFPMAIMSVLFPLFVQAGPVGRAPPDALGTARTTLRWMLVAWLPAMLVLAASGSLLLRLWIGDALARDSFPVWKWLIAGVAVNGLAHLPLNVLQSRGRTDLVAAFHLLELPVYIAGVWWALQNHGIAGAACAWTLRVTVDAFLLHACAARVAPQWWPLVRISFVAAMASAAVLGSMALVL